MSTSEGLEFITDIRIYQKVIQEEIPKALKFLWLATSDLKDLYVAEGKIMVPFLKVLSGLCQSGVELRLIHAKEPGPNFRKDFDRYPNLIEGLERLLCPRVHFKTVIVDGKFAYSGSANLTGAGMGAKSDDRRNFESGFVTTEKDLVNQIMKQYDELWMGKHCEACQRKAFCTEYQDILDKK